MKKLKIFLIALAVVILGVGGYAVYELKVKKYEVADSKVDSILEEKFEVELADGTKLIITNGNIETVESTEVSSSTGNSSNENENQQDNNSETNINADNADATSGANGSANKSANSSSKNANNPSTEQVERVTVATIKDKYNTAFKLLESQTQSRLNSLISEAKNEYTAKKNNGEKISYGYFYRKYMDAATGLESSTTSAVNAVVKLVEADLKANGYNPDHAKSYVEQYEKTKEGFRSELMKKVLNN